MSLKNRDDAFKQFVEEMPLDDEEKVRAIAVLQKSDDSLEQLAEASGGDVRIGALGSAFLLAGIMLARPDSPMFGLSATLSLGGKMFANAGGFNGRPERREAWSKIAEIAYKLADAELGE